MLADISLKTSPRGGMRRLVKAIAHRCAEEMDLWTRWNGRDLFYPLGHGCELQVELLSAKGGGGCIRGQRLLNEWGSALNAIGIVAPVVDTGSDCQAKND